MTRPEMQVPPAPPQAANRRTFHGSPLIETDRSAPAMAVYLLGMQFFFTYLQLYGWPRWLSDLEILLDSLADREGGASDTYTFIVPEGPQCFSHMFLFSDIWRTFDQGLYNFLKWYIYLPWLKPSKKESNCPNSTSVVCRRLLAGVLVFLFVLVFHSMTKENSKALVYSTLLNFRKIAFVQIDHQATDLYFDFYFQRSCTADSIWILVNIAQIFIEQATKWVYRSTRIGEILRKNLSIGASRRLAGVVCGISAMFSSVGFFFFHLGLHPGWWILYLMFFDPDNNPPEFTASEYLARPRLHDYTQKVAQLIATDKDLCVSPNYPPAGCQSVEYLITYAGTEKPFFVINHKGEIYFNSNADFKVWKSIGRASFTVVARNYGEFKKANGSTRVIVLNGPPYGLFEVPSNALDADSNQSQDCTLSMQPLMTVKPPDLIMALSKFGTKFTIQLCLPVDYTLNGILRIQGPFKMKEAIRGGSVHIVGVTYASPGFDLNDADLVVTEFSDTHIEMALDYVVAFSFETIKRCHCLDILVVAISPPIPSSSVFVDSYFDVQLYSKTAETQSMEVHFRISGHDPQILPSFLLKTFLAALSSLRALQTC
ncbi:unnamed protein product [Mesocestoides corti]|uniref:Uncharacterized protein n=1 Tax=Mesocestoides corti TaxID=53468 RepID=A0A3P6HS82_MESCO|nr:unnamed protein product [Mesocestoides corti]